MSRALELNAVSASLDIPLNWHNEIKGKAKPFPYQHRFWWWGVVAGRGGGGFNLLFPFTCKTGHNSHKVGSLDTNLAIAYSVIRK